MEQKDRAPLTLAAQLQAVAARFRHGDLAPLNKIGDTTIDLPARAMEAVVAPGRQVIFTTYFTSQSDPQRDQFVDSDTYTYIQPLYESVKQLQLNCLIFHDNLSPAFTKKYRTAHIQFVQTSVGTYSLNDERFLIYYEYLLRHGQRIEQLLFADVSDVYVTSDPFKLLEKHPNKLFVGRSNMERMKHQYVNYQRIKRFEEDAELRVPNAFYDLRIFNAGSIGGGIAPILLLLQQMITLFKRCNSNRNHNMMILNYCLFEFWEEPAAYKAVHFIPLRKQLLKIAMLVQHYLKINVLPKSFYCRNEPYQTTHLFAGYPFTSAFKKFELDSDAVLIHK